MPAMLSLVLLVLFHTSHVVAQLGYFDLALYWGQDADGQQQRLAQYCMDSTSDIIILSCVDRSSLKYTLPHLNFRTSCFSDDENCTELAQDIETCQSHGKKVILSIRDAPDVAMTPRDAENFADTVWDLFGGGSYHARPFGSVVVDGFDLDLRDGSSQAYSDVARRLKTQFSTEMSRSYLLTASVTCRLPYDAQYTALGDSTFDYFFVHYLDYCKSRANETFDDTVDSMISRWDSAIQSSSTSSKTKVLLGVHAAQDSPGYVPVSILVPAIQHASQRYPSFSGLAIWDASTGWDAPNGGLSYIDTILRGVLIQNSTVPRSTTSRTGQGSRTRVSTSSRATRTTRGRSSKSRYLSDVPTTSGWVRPLTSRSSRVRTSSQRSIDSASELGTTLSRRTTRTTSRTLVTSTTRSRRTTRATSRTLVTSTTRSNRPSQPSSAVPLPETAKCPRHGDKCPTNGVVTCSGQSFAQCDHNRWVLRACAPGTVCVEQGGSVYCDYADLHPDSECEA